MSLHLAGPGPTGSLVLPVMDNFLFTFSDLVSLTSYRKMGLYGKMSGSSDRQELSSHNGVFKEGFLFLSCNERYGSGQAAIQCHEGHRLFTLLTVVLVTYFSPFHRMAEGASAIMAIHTQPIGRGKIDHLSQPQPVSNFCLHYIGQNLALWPTPICTFLSKAAHIVNPTNVGLLSQKQNKISSTVLPPRGNHWLCLRECFIFTKLILLYE